MSNQSEKIKRKKSAKALRKQPEEYDNVELVKKFVANPFLIMFCGTVHHLVSLNVTQPFIDEKFHLRQCDVYCHYQFDQWDNKITTPPGLYILGFVYARVISSVSGIPIEELCQNYDILRSVNLLGGLCVLPLSLLLVSSFNANNFWAVNIISLPLLFSYYFLFYTDVWATVLLVLAFGLVYRNPKSHVNAWLSGLLGFASLWFRQTNIVWLAFITAISIDRRTPKQSNVIGYTKSYIESAFKNFAFLIPSLINFALFGLFLKINGGITFGDKENHTVNFHVVQVFYCMLFVSAFTLPVWLSWKKITAYLRFAVSGNYGFNIWITAVTFFGIKFVIDNFTIVHPFLLADNRHYTFYFYRKVLSDERLGLAMIPIYHFCTWNVAHTLLSNTGDLSLSVLTVGAFFGAICLTVIPSPLFEPRYYIVPLVFFRIFIQPDSKFKHIFEFVWLASINVLFMMVFFSYEFSWSTEIGIQRIIW